MDDSIAAGAGGADLLDRGVLGVDSEVGAFGDEDLDRGVARLGVLAFGVGSATGVTGFGELSTGADFGEGPAIDGSTVGDLDFGVSLGVEALGVCLGEPVLVEAELDLGVAVLGDLSVADFGDIGVSDFGDRDLDLGVDFGDLAFGVKDLDRGDFFCDFDFGDFDCLLPCDLLFLPDFGDADLDLLVCFGVSAFGDLVADFGGLFTGDSSLIGDVVKVTATDLLLRSGAGETGLSAAILGGIAPLLTGVEGGSFLSKCSGESLGPKETLFLFADGARFSEDFLFLPLPFGLGFFSEKHKEAGL